MTVGHWYQIYLRHSGSFCVCVRVCCVACQRGVVKLFLSGNLHACANVRLSTSLHRAAKSVNADQTWNRGAKRLLSNFEE